MWVTSQLEKKYMVCCVYVCVYIYYNIYNYVYIYMYIYVYHIHRERGREIPQILGQYHQEDEQKFHLNPLLPESVE